METWVFLVSERKEFLTFYISTRPLIPCDNKVSSACRRFYYIITLVDFPVFIGNKSNAKIISAYDIDINIDINIY